MNVIAFNGSPRQGKNTASLLQHALDGAAEAGAETWLVHLYNIDFKGCRSCFACKRKGGAHYGVCAVADGLTPLLRAVAACDVLLLGTPVYFGQESAAMRGLMERLFFPSTVYDKEGSSLFSRPVKTALFYTMNISEDQMSAYGWDRTIAWTSGIMRRIFGNCEVLLSADTLQFDDYSLYESSRFDSAAKMERHRTVFPQDCARAFELGKALVSRAD